ncbi:MAG: hypothetical protein SGILL_010840, partial [Bacillariaceae sp.]
MRPSNFLFSWLPVLLSLAVSFTNQHAVDGYTVRWASRSSNLQISKLHATINDNIIDDGSEEAFDLYSRDMRDQVRKESSEFRVVDDESGGTVLRLVKKPFQWVGRKISSATNTRKPGKLILLACGQSDWNSRELFTGWADPDLTAQGAQECQHAARLLLAEGYEPDLVYTSRLKRSIRSARYVLQELGTLFLPVQKSWRLNERSYGSLTGLSKSETAETMGASVVQAWRNSLKARPPPLSKNDPYYPGNDRRYEDLTEDQIPLTESLLDTMKRTVPLWEYKIKRDIANGNNVLVVGHGNTLRGLMKVIDDVSDVDIQEINLPRGIPVVYNFDKKLKPVPAGKKLSQVHTNAIFLEKPGLLETALRQQEKWKAMVPGLDADKVRSQVTRDQTMVDALEQLRAEQNAEIAIASSAKGKGVTTEVKLHERWDDDPSEFEDWDEFSDEDYGER